MIYELRFSPFVALSEGSRSIEEITNATTNVTGSLDPLGISSIGNLCWNNAINSIGLVSGTVEDETIPIVRRLVASHLTHTASKVLILHTNHSAVFAGPCSLLASSWPPPRVLVSPQAPESIFSAYKTLNGSVTPISFPDTSLTLRHVLAVFTPPHDMPGSSTILGTIQYILSQLQEPFDLQRFGELVDGEKWSEEGATFVALRQRLLTRLLSPAGDEDPEDMARQITLVDLTDPVLNSTRLDSTIMDIAVHDFLRHSAERKMIVLTNCQQYLMPTSTLRKTIESLATTGSRRAASVILSTTDPTTLSISPSFIHSLQYALFGSSYSMVHDGFLDKHFPHLSIPHEQCGFRRAVLWSPGSTLYLPKNDVSVKNSWNDLVSFIDVAQFENCVPTAGLPNGNHDKIPDGYETNHAEPLQYGTWLDSDDGGEMVAPVPSTNDLSSQTSFNEPLKQPTPTSPKSLPLEAILPAPTKDMALSSPFDPLVAAVSHLCEGEIGILVDFEDVRKQMGQEEYIQELGWATFTAYVKAACREGLLEMIEATPTAKFLSLLVMATPASASLNGNTNNGLPDIVTSAYTVDQYDTRQSFTEASAHRYLHLLKEILFLSKHRIAYKLPLKQLLQRMNKEANTLVRKQLRWKSTKKWIRRACLEGYVVRGSEKRLSWIMVTEKGHKAVQQNIYEEWRSIYDTGELPGYSMKTISTINPYPTHVLSYNPHPLIGPKVATFEASNRPTRTKEWVQANSELLRPRLYEAERDGVVKRDAIGLDEESVFFVVPQSTALEASESTKPASESVS